MISHELDLTAECKKCYHEWVVHSGRIIYPYSRHVVCPNCDNQFDLVWRDPETAKKLEEKKLGLLQENKPDPRIDVLIQKIEALESSRDADRKDLQLLRQAIDLIIKQELQKLKEDASDHNFNLNGLHERINKVEEQLEYAKKYGKFKPDE